jgi:putative Holliday junction resolvase
MADLGDDLPTEGRLMCIDLGEVRVGIAVSDPGQVVASPAETLHVPRNQDAPLVDALVNAVIRHEASGVVVGYPKSLEGREGAAARRARDIADRLRERVQLPVLLADERLTTVEAERVMVGADVSRADRKEAVDRVAASVILQSVLELQRRRRTGPPAE